MELFLSLSCGSVVKGLKTWIRANVFPVRDIFAENLARLVSSHSPLESKILETMGYWLLHTNEQLNIDQTTVRLVQDCVSLYKKKSICTLLKNLAAQHETKPQFDPIDILKSCHALIIQETQRVNTLSQKLDLWIRLWNQEQVILCRD